MCYLKPEKGHEEDYVIFHNRPKKRGKVQPNGGMTVIYDRRHRVFGVAKCNERDNFHRRLGISIALGRLFKQRGNEKSIKHVFKARELSETPSYEEIRAEALLVQIHESQPRK